MAQFLTIAAVRRKLRETKGAFAQDPGLGEAILIMIAELEKADALAKEVAKLRGAVDAQNARIEELERQLRSPAK
jgi:hypothetical protein